LYEQQPSTKRKTNQARNGRQAGALCWGKEEGSAIFSAISFISITEIPTIKRHSTPLSNQYMLPTSMASMSNIKHFFLFHPPKNFCQNGRRACCKWLASTAAEGMCCHESPLLFFLVFI
jgi:hypothetical protein